MYSVGISYIIMKYLIQVQNSGLNPYHVYFLIHLIDCSYEKEGMLLEGHRDHTDYEVLILLL